MPDQAERTTNEKRIRFTRLNDPELLPDFSNLGEVSLTTLKAALNNDSTREVLSQLKDQILRSAKNGVGVNSEQIPEPLEQSELECQTMAIINGCRTVVDGDTSEKISRGASSIVENVRKLTRSAALSGNTTSVDLIGGTTVDQQAHYRMGQVAEKFKDVGISLEFSHSNLNPIKLAERLFQEKTFLGVSQSDKFHAFCVVPLNNPTEDEFAVLLDSIGPKKQTLTIDDFIKLVLEKKLTDNHYLFRVGSVNIPDQSSQKINFKKVM